MEKLLRIKEVSEILGVKESTIRAWVFQRRLPFIKIGKLVRILPSKLEDWIKRGGSSQQIKRSGLNNPDTENKL